ncbi:MAG: transcriptional repressor [Oligoflexia bacterium]|nr:transcriptional repressor [Oligoflexia bacterium]
MSQRLNNDIFLRLKKSGFRMTAERRQLINLITTSPGHFNAEKLLGLARDRRLPISRATVYRVLPLLKQIGVIQQSLIREGQAHFELSWEQEHHDHLVCQSCNRIVEFTNSEIEALQEKIAKKYRFSLTGHVMELHGICEDCRIKSDASFSRARN